LTHPLSPNPLVQSLLRAVPELLPNLEPVRLERGPWPEKLLGGGPFLFFPEDALLGVSAQLQPNGLPHGVRLSWLGCRSVWSPEQAQVSGLQAEVLVAGGAFLLPEAALHAANQALAPWRLQLAASSQQLITQMAQVSFCARHHTAAQSLASWLLMAWYNSPGHALQVPVNSLQAGFGFAPETWQRAWQTLHNQGAVALADQGTLAEITPPLLAPLTGVACACHQKLQAQDSGL
jgi:hypothetical protein